MNRAAIFVFYDEKGIADRCIDYYLTNLAAHISRLIVVSNGEITDDSRTLFEKHTKEIYTRHNEGFDTWAYKFGLEKLGWDHAAEYDEVILANDTVFGPVFPFSEMFDEMSGRGLDFWGATQHDEFRDDFTKKNPWKCLPAHVQTYFLVLGNRLLREPKLKAYWDRLPIIDSWADAIGLHESVFTKTFADMGYSWDVYAHPEIDPEHPNPTILHPMKLLYSRFPFVKVKLFVTDTLEINAGEQPRQALNYLRDHTDYDTDLIWEKLIRVFYHYEFVRALGLNRILPLSVHLAGADHAHERMKTALLMHMYFPDMFEEALHYAESMPESSDIYITTNTEEKADGIRALFEKLPNKTEIRIAENRGRSESALLVALADVPAQYDLLCFWKEKKSNQSGLDIAWSWSYKINENLLPNKTYVDNVIATFEKDRRLGILAAPPPNHGIFYSIMGNEWTVNFNNVEALHKRLGLRSPISYFISPICPFGGAFWFRGDALKELFDYGWQYEDFPEEPLDSDGTILHSIERIYPYAAQSAGYYPAYVMSDDYAELEYSNLSHYVRSSNSILKSMHYLFYTYIDYLRILARRIRFMRAIATYHRMNEVLKEKAGPLYNVLHDIKRLLLGPNRKGYFEERKILRARQREKLERMQSQRR
ncbi:MAG: rhamnan synthesis F family protein [Clostridiales Family XIII bacterium]|jgi:rhamnosyltransferase|nr:rhamnan synthesis F family protein [Clostridiales Family XIII bacterium]